MFEPIYLMETWESLIAFDLSSETWSAYFSLWVKEMVHSEGQFLSRCIFFRFWTAPGGDILTMELTPKKRQTIDVADEPGRALFLRGRF